MKDLHAEILKLQEETALQSEKNIVNYYDKLSEIDPTFTASGFGGHLHYHVCDFTITKNKKQAILACKKYLRSKHMKRDKWRNCCDNADCNGCKYMKFILCDDTDTIIACR